MNFSYHILTAEGWRDVTYTMYLRWPGARRMVDDQWGGV